MDVSQLVMEWAVDSNLHALELFKEMNKELRLNSVGGLDPEGKNLRFSMKVALDSPGDDVAQAAGGLTGRNGEEEWGIRDRVTC